VTADSVRHALPALLTEPNQLQHLQRVLVQTLDNHPARCSRTTIRAESLNYACGTTNLTLLRSATTPNANSDQCRNNLQQTVVKSSRESRSRRLHFAPDHPGRIKATCSVVSVLGLGPRPVPRPPRVATTNRDQTTPEQRTSFLRLASRKATFARTPGTILPVPGAAGRPGPHSSVHVSRHRWVGINPARPQSHQQTLCRHLFSEQSPSHPPPPSRPPASRVHLNKPPFCRSSSDNP